MEFFYDFEASIKKKKKKKNPCATPFKMMFLYGHSRRMEFTRLSWDTLFLQEASRVQQSGQSSTQALKPLWNKIWALDVPNKVKTLIWRACKNSLPTKAKPVSAQDNT